MAKWLTYDEWQSLKDWYQTVERMLPKILHEQAKNIYLRELTKGRQDIDAVKRMKIMNTIEFEGTPTFREGLEELLRKYDKESGSDTPDYVLAEFIIAMLKIFDEAIITRDTWYNIVINSGEDATAEVGSFGGTE